MNHHRPVVSTKLSSQLEDVFCSDPVQVTHDGNLPTFRVRIDRTEDGLDNPSGPKLVDNSSIRIRLIDIHGCRKDVPGRAETLKRLND